jgi:hypothetical protein
MKRANIFKTITIACLFFALSAGNVSGALPEERPEAFAMVIDVPIRIISLGLAMVGICPELRKYRGRLGCAGG